MAELDGVKEILLKAAAPVGINPDAGYIFKWIELSGIEYIYKGKNSAGTVFNIGTTGSSSGMNKGIVEKAVDYIAVVTDHTILVDATGANRTITLPPVTGNGGTIFNIKKIDSSANTVSIEADGAEVIDNELNILITQQYTSITVQCDGSKWWIV